MTKKPPEVSIISYIDCKNEYYLQFVDSYIQNITSMKGFDQFELVIVNVLSDNTPLENQILEPYMKKYGNINRIMVNSIRCQYEAWNIAIDNSTGYYITNSNLDDRRSTEGLINLLNSVDNNHDVFYGYVTYTEHLDNILTVNPKGDRKLPCYAINDIDDLFQYNSPHCFPMWRRDCHDRAGKFRPDKFTRCGDYEFWLRGAKRAGFKFKMVDEWMGCYFYNPQGLSSDSSERSAIQLENRLMRVLYGSEASPLYNYTTH